MIKQRLFSLRNVLLAALIALPGQKCFGSGYEFEGIGARQVSRGGAAIADSADWTAIYWNPANIRKAVEDGQVNTGLEIFAGEAHAEDGNSLSSVVGPIFTKDELDSDFVLGAAGLVMKAGRFGLGFGFYTPLLQGVDFEDTSVFGQDIDYEGSAGILNWSLEAAMEIAEGLYAGAGLNVLYGRLTLDSRITNFFVPGNTATSELDGDGVGLEGIFGLRYEPSDRWTVGAVYRTGSDVELEGDSTVTTTLGGENKTRCHFELRHPPTTGIGAAFKATDDWSLHLDFTQTYWSRFSNAIRYDQESSLQTNTGNSFNWRNTWKARLGTGYRISEKTEVLGGYSYDRHALDAGSVDFANTVDVPMNRVYLGAGHRWTERFETILGGVYGSGRRSEQGVDYKLSGWQIMLETQFRLGRSGA